MDKEKSNHSHFATETESAKKTNDVFFTYKITKQIIVVIVYMCMGLAGEMIGPTLPDLKNRVGVDYEEISRALVGKDIGHLIGAISGGFLHEILCSQTDLIISGSLLLLATASALTPWTTTVPMTGTCFAFVGFAISVIDTGAHAMVMHLWADKATSPVHAMHFGYGLGALIAPQIARPFLSDEQTENATMLSTSTSSEYENDLSRIEIPYSIIAIIIACIAIVMLAFYIKGPPKGFAVRTRATANFKDMLSPRSCSDGHIFYGLAMIICLALYFCQGIGVESSYAKFLFSYAYETELLDKDQASILQSVFWLSYTLGRLGGIAITTFVSLRLIIISDLCLLLFTSCILALFAVDNVNILWTFTAFMGVSISVIYPNGMSWANLHLKVNSVVIMILVVGGSFGGVYQYLTGYLFENKGPQSLMYAVLVYSLGLSMIFVIMLLVSKFLHPNKNSYPINFDSELEICKYVESYNKNNLEDNKEIGIHPYAQNSDCSKF